jgi:hypothetical protein
MRQNGELSLLRDLSGASYMTHEDRARVAQENELTMVDDRGELTAYKSEGRKKIYVAHRGTKSWRDIGSDVSVALGLESGNARFKRAKREVGKLMESHPGYKIVSTGHSLGGSIAEVSGKDVGTVVTFNKGSGLGSLYRRRGKHQKDFINEYDPVSMLTKFQRGGKLVRQRDVKGSVHSLKSSTSQRFK